MRRALRLAALLLCVSMWGCATMMTGTTETVHIDSVPPDATVTVNGDTYRTPAVLTLSRARSHSVTVSKEGFLTVQRVISRVGNPATAGSALVGGMLFLAVDQGTGGAFRLHPTFLSVELAPQLPDEIVYRSGTAAAQAPHPSRPGDREAADP